MEGLKFDQSSKAKAKEKAYIHSLTLTCICMRITCKLVRANYDICEKGSQGKREVEVEDI